MAYDFDRAAGDMFYSMGALFQAAPCSFFMIAKFDSLAFRSIFAVREIASNDAALVCSMTGGGSVTCGQQNASGFEAATSSALSADTWYRICGSIRSATDKEIYIDGASDGVNTTDRAPSSTLDQSYLGARDPGFGASDDVGIAEFAVWDAGLTDAEGIALTAGANPCMIRPASLVAYLPLLRGAGKDLIGGTDWSATGSPTAIDHPRVFYPKRSSYTLPTPAAPGGLGIPIAAFHYNHHLGTMT